MGGTAACSNPGPCSLARPLHPLGLLHGWTQRLTISRTRRMVSHSLQHIRPSTLAGTSEHWQSGDAGLPRHGSTTDLGKCADVQCTCGAPAFLVSAAAVQLMNRRKTLAFAGLERSQVEGVLASHVSTRSQALLLHGCSQLVLAGTTLVHKCRCSAMESVDWSAQISSRIQNLVQAGINSTPRCT